MCERFFLYYRTGQSSRLRYEKSKSEGLPAIETKDLGEIRAKGSGHVPKSGASSIRARTTGKNTKEHYRRCARMTKDDWPASSLRDRDRQRIILLFIIIIQYYAMLLLWCIWPFNYILQQRSPEHPLQFTIATSANNFRGTRNFEEYDRDVTGEKCRSWKGVMIFIIFIHLSFIYSRFFFSICTGTVININVYGTFSFLSLLTFSSFFCFFLSSFSLFGHRNFLKLENYVTAHCTKIYLSQSLLPILTSQGTSMSLDFIRKYPCTKFYPKLWNSDWHFSRFAMIG